MSSTYIYTVGADGDVLFHSEFRNSWGGAMAVWGVLSEKYLGWQRYSLMTKDLQPLWDLNNDRRLEVWERIVLATTLDQVVIDIAHVPTIALAFERFHEHWAPALKGTVFSIGAQAEVLRNIVAEAKSKGWRGVCWNQTSVSGGVWEKQVPCDKCKSDSEMEPRAYNIDTDEEHWMYPGEDLGDRELFSAMNEVFSGDHHQGQIQ
jgi:hypothetical protein